MNEQQKQPADARLESEKRIATVRENPFDSLLSTITGDVADWAQNRRMAWIYGIICGWDDEAMEELAQDFNWPEHEKQRLGRLHEKFKAAAQQSEAVHFPAPPTKESVLAKVVNSGEGGIYACLFYPQERALLNELQADGMIQLLERYFKGGPAYHALCFGFIDEIGD